MNLNTAQTLYLFYLATILINLIVSSIQFTLSRETTQKYIMYYWIGQIITAICNSFFTEVNFYFVVFSNTGAFISQMILCIFMGKIRNISIPIKSFVSIHCLSLLISLVFYYFGFSTLWYVPIAMGGMTSSVLITTYLIYKNTLFAKYIFSGFGFNDSSLSGLGLFSFEWRIVFNCFNGCLWLYTHTVNFNADDGLRKYSANQK